MTDPVFKFEPGPEFQHGKLKLSNLEQYQNKLVPWLLIVQHQNFESHLNQGSTDRGPESFRKRSTKTSTSLASYDAASLCNAGIVLSG